MILKGRPHTIFIWDTELKGKLTKYFEEVHIVTLEFMKGMSLLFTVHLK